MGQKTFRSRVLDELGASPSEKNELLAYNENRFDNSDFTKTSEFPLPDEPFLSAWEGYEREAEKNGAFETLKGRLTQLSFPV